jgi:hypothetical protein
LKHSQDARNDAKNLLIDGALFINIMLLRYLPLASARFRVACTSLRAFFTDAATPYM